MELAKLRQAVHHGTIFWQKHALQRILQRDIRRDAVRQVILQGDIIEMYPDAYPMPACLMALSGENPLHVVLAYHATEDAIYIITVYPPDLAHFEADMKTRRLRDD